jgi:hypothetical protein
LHIYVPRYVPQLPPSKDPICQTSIVLPLSIKVLPNKNRQAKFRNSRIIFAVLSAMQKVYKDTYLGSLDDDPTITKIYNTKDIPLEITSLKEYLATPVQPKQNVFLVKIYIHTNHYLQDYQSNELLTDYLLKENIIININNLDNVNPVQLGFIEHIIPKNDTLQMHQNRLIKLLPHDTPKVQLHTSSLWGRTGERCKVCMVKCDKANKEGFLHAFDKHNNEKTIAFFPMSDCLSCTQDQKTTIVKRVNGWRAHYRSILINGFIDNDNNVPMVYNKDKEPDNNLSDVSVTDYLNNYVKNSQGENLFHHVYPPQNGIRQVVVKLVNFSHAASYIKVIHGELAREMDLEAQDLVFDDPTQAYLDSSR